MNNTQTLRDSNTRRDDSSFIFKVSAGSKVPKIASLGSRFKQAEDSVVPINIPGTAGGNQ